MPDNTNRFKDRTDYTQLLRPRPMAAKAHSLDGLKPAKHTRPTASKIAVPLEPSVKSDKTSTLSMHISLPTFRRPPGVGEPPSRAVIRWSLIAIFALIFFIIGYHNLWHITHSAAPASGLIRGKL